MSPEKGYDDDADDATEDQLMPIIQQTDFKPNMH